jgi:Flp pilus assembly protein TadG
MNPVASPCAISNACRTNRSERGQVLPFMGLLILVIIGLCGLSADVGKILIARAQLGRTADAAALAGVLQMPNIAKASSSAQAFATANDPGASVTVYPDVSEQQVRVVAKRTVNTVFMRVFGIKTFTVANEATAGAGSPPLDAMLAIDATSSMSSSPCKSASDSSTPGCPIAEAKSAAKTFVNALLPSSGTTVGEISYRGCYQPPITNSACINTNTLGALTSSASTLNSKIDSITAPGGSGTNVCIGLYEAGVNLLPPASGAHTDSNTQRYLIVLSDGDSNWNKISYQASPAAPPTACAPTSSGSPSSTACPVSPLSQCSPTSNDSGSGVGPHERQLDMLTVTQANALKAQGVEIYVVGLGVAGTANNDNASSYSGDYCKLVSSGGKIGNSDADSIADQRLLKCIASSTSGTNDHYYTTADPTQLSHIFGVIAQSIAFRLVK